MQQRAAMLNESEARNAAGRNHASRRQRHAKALGRVIARSICAASIPEWFGADAGYTPLLATGARAENTIAFMRAVARQHRSAMAIEGR